MTVETLDPIVPGTSYPLIFEFTKVDGTVDPQTGNTVRVMVKKSPDDTDAAALADLMFTPTPADAAAGIIRGTLPHTGAGRTGTYPESSKVHIQANHIVGGVPSALMVVVIATLNAVIDPT